MNANSSQKGKGCGCGGSATLSVATCGCGGAGCGSCQGKGIVRPRFFAGQLLTEDDLQLLTDYVGHKNRLHNRYLFGAGVVCGLEVSCHPCGDGQVIVHPGYALDCCGNDLTLDCAKTLDINGMVRDLRRDQLGGFDCDDPCPEKPAADLKGQKDAAAQIRLAAQLEPEIGHAPKPPSRRYCLYVRHCEQPSDPVMPYSTGDDCVRLACEPTRVREGLTFELRCKPASESADPLLARICACLGDLTKLRRIIELVNHLKGTTQIFSSTVVDFSVPAFIAADIDAFKTKTSELTSVQLPTEFAKADSPAAVREQDDKTATARASTINIPTPLLSETAVFVKRFEALSPAERTDLQITPSFVSDVVEPAKERIRIVRGATAANSKDAFNEVRDWLLERLSNAPVVADCTLRGRVFSIALPAFGPAISEEGTRTLIVVNSGLIDALLDYLRDCICRAFNPACEPCDDSAVLLACLELDECNVVRVCSLERTFVLSPAAVRYWLPPLRLIGNIAEKLCCDSFDSLMTIDTESHQKYLDFNHLLKSETEKILRDSFCRFTGDVDTLRDLVSEIWRLFHRPRIDKRSPTFGPGAGIEAGKKEIAVEHETTIDAPADAEVTTKAPPAAARVASQRAKADRPATAKAKAKAKAKPGKKGMPKPEETPPPQTGSEEADGKEAASEQPG